MVRTREGRQSQERLGKGKGGWSREGDRWLGQEKDDWVKGRVAGEYNGGYVQRRVARTREGRLVKRREARSTDKRR